MGHLVDAIKKLEQLRVAEEPQPAPRSRAKPAKTSAGAKAKTRRTDKPHALAGPKVARRPATGPKPIAKPVADEPQLTILCEPEEVSAAAVMSEIEVAAGPVDPAPELELPASVPPASLAIAEALAVLGVPAAAETAAPEPETAGEAKRPEAVEPIAVEPVFAAPVIAKPLIAESANAEPVLIKAVQPAIWQIPAPSVGDDYHRIAVALAPPLVGVQTSSSILLVAVSQVGIEAISPPALALALATRGSVLWIDGERQRPVTSAADCPAAEQAGWRQVASGQTRWDEAIRPTSLAGVSYVGRGPAEAATLGPESCEPPLLGLPEGFCAILVEGGLASQGARLGKACRSVGLVVAMGHDRRGEVEAALAQLAAAGAPPPLLIAAG